MRKPRNTTGMFAFIMVLLGGIYLGMGIISKHNASYSTAEVSESAQLIFLGIIFLIVGLFFFGFDRAKSQSLKELNTSGEKVSGGIVSCNLLKHMHWGMVSPYVVKYTFEYGGKTYNAKTGYIWEEPTCYQNDVITILVDRKNPKISKPIGIIPSEAENEKNIEI